MNISIASWKGQRSKQSYSSLSLYMTNSQLIEDILYPSQTHYFLKRASVAPIGSPFLKASIVFSSISNLSSQIFKHFSACSTGTTTTPSKSARIKSPGLIVKGLCCVSEVNCTGTLSPEALVKVLDPSAEVAFANTCFAEVSRFRAKVGNKVSYGQETPSPYAHSNP
jgi:hypothetical protein